MLNADLKRRFDQHRATVDEAYGAYAELRGKCPVAHSDAHGGYYLLTRHADVRKAALDWKNFSSAKGINLPPDRTRPPLPSIEYDPPEHLFWRNMYGNALTPEALKVMAPRIERIADDLIDAFAGKGGVDLVEAYSNPLPVLGITAALGLHDADPARVVEIAQDLAKTQADFEAQKRAVGRLGEFVLGEIHDRRRAPRDDYMTRIALTEIEGRLMTDDEISLFMIGFMVAGHETTSSSLANLLFHVLTSPTLRQRVIEDDKALSAAIEEAVRLSAPFHAFSRTTTNEVEVAGTTIPEDEIVRLCWASANRDPEVFQNPDEFDIDRERNPHLGFGVGRHVCAGAAFARLEMGIALRRLLARLPDITTTQEQLEMKFVGGFLTLPERLDATFSPAG